MISFFLQMKIRLFETSAKENINVEEMFRSVTELVLESKQEQQRRLNIQPDMNRHEQHRIKLTGSERPGSQKPNKNKNSSCCKWSKPAGSSFFSFLRCSEERNYSAQKLSIGTRFLFSTSLASTLLHTSVVFILKPFENVFNQNW